MTSEVDKVRVTKKAQSNLGRLFSDFKMEALIGPFKMFNNIM